MAEMHTMDCMPETLNFDLREERWRRVLSGNPLCTRIMANCYTERKRVLASPAAIGGRAPPHLIPPPGKKGARVIAGGCRRIGDPHRACRVCRELP